MKYQLLFLVVFLGNIAFSQNESFVHDIDDLKWQSNRMTALFLMQEKHKNFSLIGGDLQILDSATLIIEGKPKRVAFELIQFLNKENAVLVQFIYVDDKLFGKNISYHFPVDKMTEAEALYTAYTNMLEKSGDLAFIMGMGHDEIYYKDESLAAGKKRIYPAKRVQYDVWEGYVALVLNIPDIYKLENIHQNKGVWVYITAYNTFDCPVSTKYGFPELVPPYATIEELAGIQSSTD